MQSAPIWLDQTVLSKQISRLCESDPSWVKLCWDMHPSARGCSVCVTRLILV